MFDIGFAELLLVSIVGLIVLGPERLPGAIRTGSHWVRKFRRSFNDIRAEIEREINTDELKKEMHNNAIMQSIKAAEQDLRGALGDTPYDVSDIKPPANSGDSDKNTS